MYAIRSYYEHDELGRIEKILAVPQKKQENQPEGKKSEKERRAMQKADRQLLSAFPDHKSTVYSP